MSIFDETVDESLDRILREHHLKMFFSKCASEAEKEALEYRLQIYSERMNPYYTQLEKLIRLENKCEYPQEECARIFGTRFDMMTWIFMDKHINKIYKVRQNRIDNFTGEIRIEQIDEAVRRLVNQQVEKENQIMQKLAINLLNDLQEI